MFDWNAAWISSFNWAQREKRTGGHRPYLRIARIDQFSQRIQLGRPGAPVRVDHRSPSPGPGVERLLSFFSVGSGSSDDSLHLAQRGDVVNVTVDHRLSVLGFIHLGDLGGAQFAHSGNAGITSAAGTMHRAGRQTGVLG